MGKSTTLLDAKSARLESWYLYITSTEEKCSMFVERVEGGVDEWLAG